MSNSVVIDWAGVGSAKTKRRAEEVFREIDEPFDFKEGFWDEVVSQRLSPPTGNLIVLADLFTCASKFRRVDAYQWTNAARATNAYFVLFVRNLRDKNYASLVDDIVHASCNRAIVHDFEGTDERTLEFLIRHALEATDPNSVTDVRFSKDTQSLWLEFGDGKRGDLPWTSLSLDHLRPRLDPSTAVTAEDLASIEVRREDGATFDIDSTVLRAAFDTRLSERLTKMSLHATAELGSRLRARRKLRNLTQTELAKKCKLDQALISRVEQGKQRPGFLTLSRYAGGLGLSVSELLS